MCKNKRKISVLLILALIAQMLIGCGANGMDGIEANPSENSTNVVNSEQESSEDIETVTETDSTTEEGSETETETDSVTEQDSETQAETHIHSYSIEIVEATCTSDGYIHHKCSCGDTYKSDIVKATGHIYGDWVTVKVATSTETGEAERRCECGKTETKILSKLKEEHTHKYSSKTVKPTCTKEGYTINTCECGDSYISNTTDKVPHDYSQKVTPATCVAEGYTTFKCSCGVMYTDEITEKIEHNYVFVKNVQASCYLDGFDLYKCSFCHIDTKKNIVPAAHSIYVLEKKEADCENAGYCIEGCHFNCGYNEKIEYPAIGHNYVNDICIDCGQTKPYPQINHESIDVYYGHEVRQHNDGSFLLKINNLEDEQQIIWESADENIATVDGDGNVYPQNYGVTYIYGKTREQTFSCKVNIQQIKVYFAREYTDSSLLEAERIHWFEDGDFEITTGYSKPYKIMVLSYDNEGNVIGEIDATSSFEIVPTVEGYFNVDVKNGRIKALKGGTNQEDGSSNIKLTLTKCESTSSAWNYEFEQVLMLKVFTEDFNELLNEYSDSFQFFNDRNNDGKESHYIGCYDVFTAFIYAEGTHFTHDDQAIHYPYEYFYYFPEGTFTWESSNESVIKITGTYGSCGGITLAYATVEYVDVGTTTITVKFNGKVMQTIEFTVLSF